MFQSTTQKRDAGEMLGEETGEDRMLRRFCDIVRSENKVIVDSFEKRFLAIENRQAQLESHIEELERKAGRIPGGLAQQAADFHPKFVEVKGFCSWSERLELCATRADAEQLMALLVLLLPEQLRSSVKPVQLRGLRNFSIQIPVEPSVIREVKGIWSDHLKTGSIHGPNKAELYITLQKSPAQRTKYGAMGKLFEFIRNTHIKETGQFRAFGAPDFSIYSKKNQGAPVLVAHLDAANNVVWSDTCQTVMGLSAEDAAQKLAEYQRV
eukprot:TRINITY_DN27283_c0_g3_i1.p2 TRINITY_DN27283_c0_g3~~TRINITY_DN27283_c0_g3_i1.p2  ORF type:complete len:267 (-),score=55.90 TRINITY_DN27283_c0_g3_i1:3056-3856(-)